MVLDGKSPQEYLVIAGVPQDSTIGPKLSLRYSNDLPDHVICNIAIYADNKCDQASDLWQQIDDTTSILSVIRHLICGN